MKIYILIVEDRHADVGVTVYVNKERAIADAREVAQEEAKHYNTEPREEEIDGWLYYATFYREGDSVHVIKGNLIREGV